MFAAARSDVLVAIFCLELDGVLGELLGRKRGTFELAPLAIVSSVEGGPAGDPVEPRSLGKGFVAVRRAVGRLSMASVSGLEMGRYVVQIWLPETVSAILARSEEGVCVDPSEGLYRLGRCV